MNILDLEKQTQRKDYNNEKVSSVYRTKLSHVLLSNFQGLRNVYPDQSPNLVFG